MCVQRVVRDAKQRQPASTGCCLNRAELELLSDAHELLADVNHVLVEVDISPGQTEHFTAPQLGRILASS